MEAISKEPERDFVVAGVYKDSVLQPPAVRDQGKIGSSRVPNASTCIQRDPASAELDGECGVLD